MRIVAFETSSKLGSQSFWSNGQCVFDLKWDKPSSHSEVLTQNFIHGLNTVGWHISDITHLAVSLGPGSFTGVRVGLNFVKALSYSLGLPVWGCSSLFCLAESFLVHPSFAKPTLSLVTTLVPAVKNQIYLAQYQITTNGLKELISPQSLHMMELDRWIQNPTYVLGEGYGLYVDQFPQALANLLIRPNEPVDHPSAHALGSLLTREINDFTAKFFDWTTLQPLYIRRSEAEEKLKES